MLCVRCSTRDAGVSSWVGFTGALREHIKTSICEVCYQEWLKTQLMAINEYRLNLGKPEHHAVLAQLAAQFFSFTEVRAAAEEGASLSHLEKVWTPEKPNQ